jgi:hypothetical protein
MGLRRLAFLVALASLGATTGPGAFDRAEAYRLNCAPCHGTTGRLDPDSPRYATFRRPPADLSDPTFNSMEPSADWFMVVKHGGRPMGLSSQMPAFGGAFTDPEIEALVAYIKGLAETSRYPPGDLNFLRPIDTIKAFPETEALFLYTYEELEAGGSAVKSTAYYANRIGPRYQVEVKLSRADVSSGPRESELEAGLKWAFHDNLAKSRLLTAGIEAEIPLDDDEGDRSTVLVPYVSLAKGLSGPFTLQGTLRTHLPADEFGDGDVKLSAVVHWMPSPWPRSAAPALEMTWKEPFSSGDDREVSAIPQLFVGLNRRGHVAFTAGVELPLTDTDYDYRVRTFLLWDIADGPFWQGW